MESARKDGLNGSDALATQPDDLQHIDSEPQTCVKRLEELRRQVKAGTYLPSSEQIADALLRAHKRAAGDSDGEKPRLSSRRTV